jgi:exonuclease VII small subunit
MNVAHTTKENPIMNIEETAANIEKLFDELEQQIDALTRSMSEYLLAELQPSPVDEMLGEVKSQLDELSSEVTE